MQIEQWKVGEFYQVLQGAESTVVDITDNGIFIIVKFNSPTKKEIKDFKKGSFKFKFLELEGVMWCLLQIAKWNWTDAPYHAKLSKNLTKLETPTEGLGYNVLTLFADCQTGLLHGIHLSSLTTKQSEWIKNIVEKQLSEDIFVVSQYRTKISKTMQKYKTDDLVKIAEV